MSEYRIVEHNLFRSQERGREKWQTCFEPQMLYRSPMAGADIWFPLNQHGFWLEPSAYCYGALSLHLLCDKREDAERIITRAKAINEEHIREAEGQEGGKDE